MGEAARAALNPVAGKPDGLVRLQKAVEEREAVSSDEDTRNDITLSRHVVKSVLVLAFASVLVWPNNILAQTSHVSVANVSFLPIDPEIIDALCDVTIFRGRITAGAEITTRPSCVDRNGKVHLILIDLSRRQSYRFTGSPGTIMVRRGAG